MPDKSAATAKERLATTLKSDHQQVADQANVNILNIAKGGGSTSEKMEKMQEAARVASTQQQRVLDDEQH